MNIPKEIPVPLLIPVPDLNELEKEIRAALRTAWVMLALLVAVSLVSTALVLAPRILG